MEEESFKIVCPNGYTQTFTPEEMCEVLTHMMWPLIKYEPSRWMKFNLGLAEGHGIVATADGNEMFPSALKKTEELWEVAKTFVYRDY